MKALVRIPLGHEYWLWRLAKFNEPIDFREQWCLTEISDIKTGADGKKFVVAITEHAGEGQEWKPVNKHGFGMKSIEFKDLFFCGGVVMEKTDKQKMHILGRTLIKGIKYPRKKKKRIAGVL